MTGTRLCRVLRLPGLTDYDAAWRYQRVLLEHAHALQKRGGDDAGDALLLLEHPRILTLGRGATLANIRARDEDDQARRPRLVRVERGGEVTWHGPGQLVAYPILNLSRPPHRRDLHWYTHGLEECVVRALRTGYGVASHRSPVNTGVWVGTNKIAAIGVSASRWFTFHGVCVNVNPCMDDYGLIVPCGIAEPGHGVCSLHQLLQDSQSPRAAAATEVSVEAFLPHFARAFEEVFQASLQPAVAAGEVASKFKAEAGAGIGTDTNATSYLEALLDVHPEIRAQSLTLPL